MDSEASNSMAHGSETSIECFQNYTASEIFVQGLAGLVNFGDVEVMIRAQKQMLQRFEKTNEMLLNCNALSNSRLKNSQEDFKKMTKMLLEMKKDLDYVFKKVRVIKSKLSNQYPSAFEEAQKVTVHIHDVNEEEEEEEIEDEVLRVEQDELGDDSVLNSEICGKPRNTALSLDRRQNSTKTTVQYMKMDDRNDSSE